MQSRIEEGHQILMNDITFQLQKEKEDEILQGCQKILEEVELQLEDVHDNYEGIISKERVIKEHAQRIKDAIIPGNKTSDMDVQKEEKPSSVKPYRHPHYQEILQEEKEEIK